MTDHIQRNFKKRNEWFAFCIAVCCSLPVLRANAAEPSRFADGGYVIIDGKPRLILGMYELPKEDAKLRELAENGFNLVHVPADAAALDRVQKHGLYAWIALGGMLALPENDEKARQALTETINRFKNHPVLLAWEAPDEALWNVWYGRQPWISGGQSAELRKLIDKAKETQSVEKISQWTAMLDQSNDYTQRGLWKKSEEVTYALWKALGAANPHPDLNMSLAESQAKDLGERLTRGWQHVRSLDAKHVLWQNHAPRNSIESMRLHNRAVDAAGCDIYPVPSNYGVGHSDLTDMNLTSVGAYTDRMRAAAPGKAVWMVLQGFGWRDLDKGQQPSDPNRGRRPHLHETRFMAYNAILHGAGAILYWGTAYIEKDSPLWADLMRVGREIRALEPAIVGQCPERAPEAVGRETFASIDGQGPRLMLRRAGDDWVLIAANECAAGVAFDVTGLPPELNGKILHRLYTDESHRVADGRFIDGIVAHGVHIYATSRRFETK